jgi:prepilin-type N-terminal cleavage/methylation domain-containing protein
MIGNAATARRKAMHQVGKKAYTLIELLVVIAVIAILAALLFPVFARVREKARQATCLSNQKQIAAAVLMYISDYDETFPFVLNSSANWNQASGGANVGDDGKPVIGQGRSGAGLRDGLLVGVARPARRPGRRPRQFEATA